MEYFKTQIHGSTKFFAKEKDKIYFSENAKKGWVWTETMMTMERAKKLRPVSVQEIIKTLEESLFKLRK